MYVIAGITGNTGAAAAEALLARGKSVRAIVRDESRAAAWAARGVELRRADLADAESLAQALEGAAGAYLLAPPLSEDGEHAALYVAVARSVRTAALRAGLPHLVFLSSEGAHIPAGTGVIRSLHLAETELAGAAPRVTFLRASYFQDNWRAVLPVAAAEGTLPTMLGDGKRAMVAAADVGRAAAALLLEENPPDVVNLTGPEDYAPSDVAAALGAALGRHVTPARPPRTAWEATLEAAGLRPSDAALMAEMYDAIDSGLVRFEPRGEIRRGTITVGETVASWSVVEAV
jgi:NAD(P)H dehydrogenase (quinone)